MHEHRWRLRAEQSRYVPHSAALHKNGIKLQAKDVQGRPLPLQIFAGTEFRLHSQAAASGYLHILGIYEHGGIDILRQDIDNPNQGALQIPATGIFEAATLPGSNKTTDVYLALTTDKPLGYYPLLAQTLSEGITGDNFSHLITAIKKHSRVVNTVVMTISQ